MKDLKHYLQFNLYLGIEVFSLARIVYCHSLKNPHHLSAADLCSISVLQPHRLFFQLNALANHSLCHRCPLQLVCQLQLVVQCYSKITLQRNLPWSFLREPSLFPTLILVRLNTIIALVLKDVQFIISHGFFGIIWLETVSSTLNSVTEEIWTTSLTIVSPVPNTGAYTKYLMNECTNIYKSLGHDCYPISSQKLSNIQDSPNPSLNLSLFPLIPIPLPLLQ